MYRSSVPTTYISVLRYSDSKTAGMSGTEERRESENRGVNQNSMSGNFIFTRHLHKAKYQRILLGRIEGGGVLGRNRIISVRAALQGKALEFCCLEDSQRLLILM